MRALFLGRFQPFHNGHLADLKKAVAEFDEVVIAIGSSQESGTDMNPYDCSQRRKMIEAVLKDEAITNVRIFCIEDINDNDHFVDHVLKQIPECGVFFSGNPLTERLFKEGGFEVRKLQRLWDLSATEVRKRIKEGKDWEDLVPPAVSKYIKSEGR